MNTHLLNKPFRVLSLDGGGIRGIYTAKFLDRICKEQSKRTKVGELDIGRGFDLIVGTSTGAIVGCAAAIGCPMDRVVKMFEKHGPDIFPHRIHNKYKEFFRVCHSGSVRKGNEALKEALSSILGNITLSDVYKKRKISMSIPTVRMSTHSSWVFKKTPASGSRDDNYSLVDICMATSAAPIYRSLAAIKSPDSGTTELQVFADGGLWANNPVLVALVDAIAITKWQQPIEIFSLGTCPRPEGEHIEEESVHRSILDWTFGADVVPLSINAQEFAYDNIAKLLSNSVEKLGGKISVIRFPRRPVPASMMPYLGLDDTRSEALKRLIGQADTDVDMTLSACDNERDSDGQKINALLNVLPPLERSKSIYDGDL